MRHSASLRSGTWPAIIATIARSVDLETTSRQFQALQRKRKIKTAEALLRLALMWGPGGRSLRAAAALAGEAGIAELSDKAVEGRLRKMASWPFASAGVGRLGRQSLYHQTEGAGNALDPDRNLARLAGIGEQSHDIDPFPAAS